MNTQNYWDHKKLRNLEKCLFLFFDITCFLIAFGVARMVRYLSLSFEWIDILHALWPLAIIVMANSTFDLYRTDFRDSPLKMPGMSLVTSLISLLLTAFSIYLLGIEQFIGEYHGRGVLLGTFGGFALLAASHRLVLHRVFEKVRGQRNYLVLANLKEYNHLLQEGHNRSEGENFDFLAAPNSDILLSRVRKTQYVGIIVGSEILKNDELIKILMQLRLAGLRIFNMHDFFENVWFKIPIPGLRDQWFVTGNGFVLLHNPVGLKVKRILDIALSLILMLATAPLMFVVALAIKMSDFGPIIYSQKRTGKNRSTFTLYKFRSMKVNAEAEQARWAAPNDLRVTKIGKTLRIMRIDELPQIWNVFKGEMSFIGPRPERPEFNSKLEKNIPYYNLRHLLRPGITGWAQVLYPYGASEKDALEKLQYDLYYLKNYSLLLDFSIIIKTIKIVLFGRGGR